MVSSRLRAVLVALLFVVPGCGSDGGETRAPDVEGSSLELRRCEPRDTPPNDAEWTLEVNGVTRSALVHMPPDYDATSATPIVLNFHGLGQQPENQKNFTRMNELADREGFIVLYPRGEGEYLPWNAGPCCGGYGSSEHDDVAFVATLLDAIPERFCVDRRRVFATGFSNGAMLTHRLACELSDRIAAFAPVAGGLLEIPCEPARSVPLLHFHGSLDPLYPYGGNPIAGFPPVEDVVRGWAARSGCEVNPKEISRAVISRCETFPSCERRAEVTLCTSDGAGHTWPGGEPTAVGVTAYDVNANELMWSFFERHPLRR